MNALAKTDYAAWSLPEAVVSDFIGKGAHVLDDRLNERACADLLAEIRGVRRFDESLFLSESEFAETADLEAPGQGALEKLGEKLAFVERAPQVVEALWSLLGPDFRILEREVVCVLPARAVPGWVARRNAAAEDLSPYVRPERRGLAYRASLDAPPPLAPAGDDAADVVILDVYLHPVAEADAPLRLMEGSHRTAPAAGPALARRAMLMTERVVAGEAGLAVLRHGAVLCGHLAGAEHERISLRYRVGRGSSQAAGIDAVNAALAGPRS